MESSSDSYPQQVRGQVRIRQAGRRGRGAPQNRFHQVQQSNVAVESEGVEVRMDHHLLDLDLLLALVRTLFVVVS